MAAPVPVPASSPAAFSPPTGTSGTALPWQPAALRDVALSASAGAAAWPALIASTPYLAATRFSDPTTVYLPPTVLQLSEAAGCSVTELAGAYNDLPAIRLSKEMVGESAAPIAAAEMQTFDAFDYLQLAPVDETLELATNAVRARRPVPDAEETFWETDYWEKLKRIKQEQQQRKDLRRQNKLAQEAKKAPHGAAGTAVSFPAAYALGNTISSTNSPSFLTPHSRQGSLSGHAGDTDTSPTMATLQSVQRQKRIAKGLLRRARYNETHNPSHPQPHPTRSASVLSQNSAGTPQSVVRRRARPRSYSTNSQQTDARGFQYSLSSAMSESGHSALSDSLRTPPLLPINAGHPPREALATSPDMELLMSAGATKSGATTHSRNSAVVTDRGTTPKVSPAPPHDAGPSQRTSPGVLGKSDEVRDPTSPLSYDSDHVSTPGGGGGGAAATTAAVDALCTPPSGAWTPPRAIAALRIPLVTLAPSPSPSPSGQQAGGARAASAPSKAAVRGASLPAIVAKAPPSTREAAGVPAASPVLSGATPPAPSPALPPVSHTGAGGSSNNSGSGPRPVVKGEPEARCATARPSSSSSSPAAAAARTGYTAGSVATSRPPKSSPFTPSSTRRLSVEKPPPPPPPPVAHGEINTAASFLPTKSVRGPPPAAATHKGLQVQCPDIVVGSTGNEDRDTRVKAPPAATAAGGGDGGNNVAPKTTDAAICDPSRPASPASPAPVAGRSRIPTAAPTPLSSPQVAPTAELVNGRSAAVFITPSGSATPRATAPTVPPSRTPTRETSTSPRFERVVAVHNAAPTSPYRAEAQLPASQEGERTPPSTPDTSPAWSLAATQPARVPAGNPTPPREGGGSVQVTAAPTPRPADSISRKGSEKPPAGHAASDRQKKADAAGGERRAASRSAAGNEHETATRIHGRSRAAAPPQSKQEKKSAAACCTVM